MYEWLTWSNNSHLCFNVRKRGFSAIRFERSPAASISVPLSPSIELSTETNTKTDQVKT